MKVKKTSFSLAPSLINDLDYIASRMGISRSALLMNISQVPISDLRKLLEGIPENPSQADILRNRGESRKIITQRMDELIRMGVGDAVKS